MKKSLSGDWVTLMLGLLIACAACARPVLPTAAPAEKQALFFYEFYSPM